MSDLDLDEDLRIRAAWLYYMEGLTQDQVAQELGMTRARWSEPTLPTSSPTP